jgi:hypothetical protein
MANTRKSFFYVVGGLLTFLGAVVVSFGQMASIYRFRNVNVPISLKVEGTAIAKGNYDLEFMRTSSPVLYFVRFMKRGKILAVAQGEEWPYAGGLVADVASDRSIPKSPVMKMKINRAEQKLRLIMESGRNNLNYPMIRAVFELPIED